MDQKDMQQKSLHAISTSPTTSTSDTIKRLQSMLHVVLSMLSKETMLTFPHTMMHLQQEWQALQKHYAITAKEGKMTMLMQPKPNFLDR